MWKQEINFREFGRVFKFYERGRNRVFYSFKYDEKCENLECDLLHQLEIEKLSVSEKNKLATKLRDCLRDRRYYKNIVEEDAPLANIIGDVDIKNCT